MDMRITIDSDTDSDSDNLFVPNPPPLLLPPPILENSSNILRHAMFRRRTAFFEENDLEDVKITLNKDSFNKLKTIDKCDDICSICWEEMLSTSIILPCNHKLHVKCGESWLLFYSYKCPLCNSPSGERNISF